MTKAEYIEFHKECCEKMTQITKKKNADYCGEGDDPFANFKLVGSMNICSVEVGFLTRITDKISRLNSFVQKGFYEVADESVEDTLLDAANYLILMAGYIKSKNQTPRIPSKSPFSDSVDAKIKLINAIKSNSLKK